MTHGTDYLFGEVLVGAEFVTMFGVVCRKVHERGAEVIAIPGRQELFFCLLFQPQDRVIRE